MVKLVIAIIVTGIILITVFSGIRYGTDPVYWGWVTLICTAAAAILWDKFLRKK